MQLYSKILKGVQLEKKGLFEVDNSIYFSIENFNSGSACSGENRGQEGQGEVVGGFSGEPQIMKETEGKAALLIKQAREQAEAIVRESQEKAEEILQEHREKGFREGSLKGREEGQRIRREAEQFLEEVTRVRQEMIQSLEQEMVELSVTIAQAILQHQLSVNRESVVETVSTAMKKLNEQSYILIRVNPREVDILKKNKDRLQLLLTDRARLEILGDCEITPGSCRVEGDYGLVEINLQENLKEVQGVLEEVMKSVDHSENQS